MIRIDGIIDEVGVQHFVSHIEIVVVPESLESGRVVVGAGDGSVD
ncbi:MAG: hypothetical protein UV20_C0035G0005 [Candidatus Magasanikbacteria bacterium GW2011_GWA2_42_32]|uniref:Uncharacterized protein n=1 Tax=Candidatus Magasanikbacteria bacterium GW2011_GWA2_42_32 TaxID=1619039 RepID=A0A0G1A066_9BACT|nr:MAG: hypothetical protein UV20_C0035G0005 [Candidatus Magasanikbacteria bacterium GW2011_GWA2_42_32]